MSYKITNPLSSNQIVDVPVTVPDCLDIECPTLNNWLESLGEKVCEHDADLDISTLDLSCITPTPTTFQDLLQDIIDDVFCVSGGGNPTDPFDNVANFNFCITDGWDCNSTTTCLDVVVCNNPVPTPTYNEVIQSLINRVNAQAAVIKSLCARLDVVETDIDTVETNVSVISNCCSNNIVNRVSLLESAVTTIQNTCCP